MTDEMKARGVHSALRQLRSRGWSVAVHNDYMLNGQRHTFWLFTASHGPYFAKGESTEDIYALNQVLGQADTIDIWSREHKAVKRSA